MDLAALAALLEASATGVWMRSSGWAYPVVNLVHLLGLVLLIGPILLLDLRVLGLGRQLPLRAVCALLTPWCVAGLLLLLGSGVLLFAADATPLFSNQTVRIKLLLICVGVLNALAFRRVWGVAPSRLGSTTDARGPHPGGNLDTVLAGDGRSRTPDRIRLVAGRRGRVTGASAGPRNMPPAYLAAREEGNRWRP
jgi:hypothetical protein